MRAKFGAPKANRAAAHKLAKIIYAMLKHGKEFIELSQTDFEEHHKEKTFANMQRKASANKTALIRSQMPFIPLMSVLQLELTSFIW